MAVSIHWSDFLEPKVFHLLFFLMNKTGKAESVQSSKKNVVPSENPGMSDTVYIKPVLSFILLHVYSLKLKGLIFSVIMFNILAGFKVN